MPARDGTGPVGKGPMTGAGAGSCILSIPDNTDMPVRGLAGEAGWPFTYGGKPKGETKKWDIPGFEAMRPGRAGLMAGGMRRFCAGPGGRWAPCRFGGFGRGPGGRAGYGRANRTWGGGPGGWRQADFNRGWGFSIESETSLEALRCRVRYFKEAMEAIEQRIKTLESATEKNH